MESNKSLKLLVIEDSDEDAQLLLRELRRAGYDVSHERVETAETLQAALARETWDLVICDYSLPRFDAPHALEILKESGLDLPFIIVSGTIGEESAISALKAGAHDFIIKGRYARLGPAIEREVSEAGVRHERRRAEAALREKEQLLSEAQRIGRIGSWSFYIARDVLQFSDEMYRLFGISPAQFNHDSASLLELVHPADRPAFAAWLNDIRTGQPVEEIDFRVPHPDGRLRHMQCRGAVVLNETYDPVRFVGTIQDISERRLHELQIRRQISRLTALRTIDQAIMSSFDMHFTLDIVLLQVINQLQVDAAGILLLDATGQQLEYTVARGFYNPGIRASTVRIQDSYAGRAVMQRRMVRVEDLRPGTDYPVFRSLFSEEDFITYHAVPLIAKGKVKGVLEIYHRKLLQPELEWTDFLEILAGQAAIAIDNATLFEHLEQSNFELQQAYDATIEGWSHALDLRDRETEGHTLRVTEMAVELARIMGMDDEKIIHMRRGGLLHDIGKLGVPDNVLLKAGPLTEEEWRIMRMHPQFAHDWLAPIEYLREAVEIPYTHHEKWDGTGYPRGLKGEAIPLASRIFALADVWDALTSGRPYREPWPDARAADYIRRNSGLHFDPQIVDIFLEYISRRNRMPA